MVKEPAALLGEIADTLPFIAKLLTYFRAAGLPGADHKIGFESGFRLIRVLAAHSAPLRAESSRSQGVVIHCLAHYAAKPGHPANSRPLNDKIIKFYAFGLRPGGWSRIDFR